MGTVAIHRLVEQQAASHGDTLAVVDAERSMTYRELNQRANTVARHLIACGLRRGSHAAVAMESGVDLPVVLLAVLKAGGCYTWRDPSTATTSYPQGVSIAVGRDANEDVYRTADVTCLLRAPAHAGPNLPVLTRGSDLACVLEDTLGVPAVRVPHDTIVSLRPPTLPPATSWAAEHGAFDLWLVLMAGGTATVVTHAHSVAA